MIIKTRTKIFIARVLCGAVLAVRRVFNFGHIARVRRGGGGGIQWELDLTEGVDFAIFLFGVFDRSAVRAFKNTVKPGAVVLDIGANIGAQTLHLAAAAGPGGRVFAVEPSDFAFAKLNRNLELNPHLAERVTACQVFLDAGEPSKSNSGVYASWPLTGGKEEKHALHGGRMTSAESAAASTLDQFVCGQAITRIDLIKIDVDGNELELLRGADETLRRFQPVIIMEMAPYVMNKNGDTLQEFLDFWRIAGYTLFNLESSEALPRSAEKIQTLIPHGAGINVKAEPGLTQGPN